MKLKKYKVARWENYGMSRWAYYFNSYKKAAALACKHNVGVHRTS